MLFAAQCTADCLSMPHVVHAAFSLASSILFFVVALLLVVADHELEPMSHSLLAAPHSMCELRMLLCKTVITVADILLRPAPHYQVVVYAAACVLMLWYQLRWVSESGVDKEVSSCQGGLLLCCSSVTGTHATPAVCTPKNAHFPNSKQAPHLNAWINCLRAGLNSILAWISVSLMALTFSVKWESDTSGGSHAHYTWSPWSARQTWTMVRS